MWVKHKVTSLNLSGVFHAMVWASEAQDAHSNRDGMEMQWSDPVVFSNIRTDAGFS